MTDDVSVPLPDGKVLRAAFAIPDGPGPHPGVLVIHEAFGLNDDMRRVTDRLAGAGYAAIAPDLFSTDRRAVCLFRIMGELARGGGGRSVEQLQVAHRWLAARDRVDAERLAVIGFCMGGGLALLYASPAPAGVGAVSVNYGRVPPRRERLRGVCPVVASYGGRDMTTRPDASRLRAHLDAFGVPMDVKVYPSAGHSFMSPGSELRRTSRVFFVMRAGYRHDDAEDSWQRILSFFETQVRRRTD